MDSVIQKRKDLLKKLDALKIENKKFKTINKKLDKKLNKLKQDNELDKEEIEFNKKTTDSSVQNDEELIKKNLDLTQTRNELIKQNLEQKHKTNELIKQRNAIANENKMLLSITEKRKKGVEL